MPAIRTPAIVLHSFPYGDTSKILRLLTPDYGLRSVIAKGAMTPKSRFGGVLEPFTEGEAQFNLREGRELLTLTGFSLTRSRQQIGRDLTAFSGASVLSELMIRFGTEEAHPELFTLMVKALNDLADPDRESAATAIAALWALVSLMGFQPATDACLRCGRSIGPEESTGFDVAAGGVVCDGCGADLPRISATLRVEVGAMCEGNEPTSNPKRVRAHGALFTAFITSHLAADRPMRTLPLFLEQLR